MNEFCRTAAFAVVILAGASGAGCASSRSRYEDPRSPRGGGVSSRSHYEDPRSPRGGGVSSRSHYEDPRSPRGGGDFTSYDMQQCASSMIDQLLANRALDGKIARQFPKGGKLPVVAFSRIHNQTLILGLDLSPMNEIIRNRLINSEKFDFFDDGAVNFAPDYILSGHIYAINDGNRYNPDNYYLLSMQLSNTKTGLIDWSAKEEIRKTSSKPSVGW